MAPGEQFCFICEGKMAERIDRPILKAGGEIIECDKRSYCVVMTVRKK